MVDESLLREPADRCVRLVALSLLADAQKAGDRLTSVARELRDGNAESDDALHDFRVVVRRLRSWIRAFEPWLRDAVSRKQRRRLSRIADATAATRDATVHLEWLREERPALSARQRVGHAWLHERLETQRKDGADAALAAASDFDAMAHRARIAAKRLRYLTEPVAKLASEGGAIIEMLSTLQNALGDLHDVHVFAEEVVAATEDAAASQARRVSEVVLGEENGEDRVRRARSRDPGPGLLRLAHRLHERGAHAYASIERDWLNDAGASFFDRVRALADEITRRSSPRSAARRSNH